jgi:hypothetical protein
MPFDRNDGPAMARRHDVRLDQALKLIVKCRDQPIRIVGGFNECRRDRIAWNP